jgi:hypothetical protein
MPRNADHDARLIRLRGLHTSVIDSVEQKNDAYETQSAPNFDRVERLDDSEHDGLEKETEPGGLLRDLEARQDEVLQSLSDLDRKIRAVLADLGVTVDENDEVGEADYLSAMRQSDSDGEGDGENDSDSYEADEMSDDPGTPNTRRAA